MPMAKCRRIGDLIGPYVYDELSEAERRSVESHLRGCERCRAEADAVRELVARLPTALSDAPLGAEQRVLRGVQQHLAARRPALRGALRPVLLAAAALAVGVWIGSRLPRTGPAPAPAPPRVQPAPVEARTARLNPATDSAAPQVQPVRREADRHRWRSGRALHRGVTPRPVPRPQKVSAPKPPAQASGELQATAPPADHATSAEMTPTPGPGEMEVRKVTVAPRPVGGDDVQVAEVVAMEIVR